MGFDIDKFKQAQFEFREKEVPVPNLKSFFDKNEKAVFKIRNLTALEIHRSRQAVLDAVDLEGIVERIAGGTAKDKIMAVVESLGFGDGLPDSYVRNLRVLQYGTLEPELDLELCKKIADSYSTTFEMLVKEIERITGLGKTVKELGESKPSGKTPKSS